MNQYVLSLSYGKDSLACLGAIEKLGWPLDRIVHAEIWATDTISADLPPMLEFKHKADAIIKERYGIEVEHLSAIRGGRRTLTKSVSTLPSLKESLSEQSKGFRSLGVDGVNTLNTATKLTYENLFYREMKSKQRIYGFPMQKGQWCNSDLKRAALQLMDFSIAPCRRGLTQILWCNILALLWMNLSDWHGWTVRPKYPRWLLSDGRKQTQENGVKRTTCYLRFTPVLPVAGAGSVTIKV